MHAALRASWRAQIRSRECALQQCVTLRLRPFLSLPRARTVRPRPGARFAPAQAPLKPRSLLRCSALLPSLVHVACSSHCLALLMETLSLADCYTHLERDGFPCDDGDPQTTEDQVSVSAQPA